MLRFYLDKLIQTLDELPDVINNSISNDTITRREMIVFYIKELQSVSSLFGLKVSATQAAKIIDMLEENIPLDIDMLKEIDRLKRKFALIFNKKSSIPIVYKRIEAVLFLLKSRH